MPVGVNSEENGDTRHQVARKSRYLLVELEEENPQPQGVGRRIYGGGHSPWNFPPSRPKGTPPWIATNRWRGK